MLMIEVVIVEGCVVVKKCVVSKCHYLYEFFEISSCFKFL
jgi:hypothetical protein